MSDRFLRLQTRHAVGLGPIALAASVIVGVGCAIVEREHLKLDSPTVSAPASVPVCARDATGRLQTLEPGMSCHALVRAADWHSTTNVRVEPNWSIEVFVPSGQLWYDAGRINAAPQGDGGSFLMRQFGGLKRHNEPYFALMATVVDCESSTLSKPALRQCRDVPGGQPVRISHPIETLVISAAGELAFHVNDAVFPWRWHDMFYWNNEGQIWIRITLVAKA